MAEIITATRVPLTTRPLDATVAWHDARAVTIAELLADAGALGRSLPRNGVLINACANRYAFLVGFVACVLRGRICLLPGERTAQRLAMLRRAYPDSALLADDGAGAHDEAIAVPILTGAPLRDDPERGPAEDQIASIAFTSGSTGEPLGHARRWGSLMRQMEAVARRFDLLGPETVSVASTVPHSHMYGFETTILLPLRAAIAVHTGSPLYPDDVRRVLAALPAPRMLVTSPVHLRALVGGDDQTVAPIRLVISATAPLSADLASRVETRLATNLLEIYGCTEAGSVASRRSVADTAWEPFDGLSVASTADAPDSAYVRVIGEPRPLPLNDVLTAEADGRFRLLGRREDMIKVGGKRASLAGLTASLLSIEGVQDGMMVMPDATHDDDAIRPCVIVVAPGLTPKMIIAALRRCIDPVFVPRRAIMVEALPRDHLGKLPKARIAALLGTAESPEAVVVTLQFPSDHPALAGHFPERPLIPGVVLLDAIARAARTAFALGALDRVPRAKFTRPVDGGASIQLQLRRTALERVAYEARLGDMLVAAGEMRFAEAAGP